MSAIIRQLDYPRCTTKNCWCSVDAHFQNGAGSVSLPLLLVKAACTSFMNVCIQLPLRLPKMQDQKSLTHRWLSFPGWGREHFSLVFDYKGGQYIRREQRYTNVNILRLAIGYLNATINRITRKPEPEIGTNRSCQTRQNPLVDRYVSGFGLPRCRWFGFWTGLEPNWTVLAVRAWTSGGLPGPVATLDLAQIELSIDIHYYSDIWRLIWISCRVLIPSWWSYRSIAIVPSTIHRMIDIYNFRFTVEVLLWKR